MDHIELENKLTIFRHALTNMRGIVLNRIDNLCNAIWGMSGAIHRHKVESINEDIFNELYGCLSGAFDDTEELLMVLKELAARIRKSLPHPMEKSQNETNKEIKND